MSLVDEHLCKSVFLERLADVFDASDCGVCNACDVAAVERCRINGGVNVEIVTAKHEIFFVVLLEQLLRRLQYKDFVVRLLCDVCREYRLTPRRRQNDERRLRLGILEKVYRLLNRLDLIVSKCYHVFQGFDKYSLIVAWKSSNVRTTTYNAPTRSKISLKCFCDSRTVPSFDFISIARNG